MITRIMVIILLLLGLSSCHNVDDVVGPKSKVKNPSFFFAPTSESLDEGGLLCTFSVYKSKMHDNNTNQTIDFSGIDACFYSHTTDAAIYAGDVTFNNWYLPMLASIDSTYLDTLYSYGINNYNAPFDGMSKTWTVSGSSFFQQLSFSITAPFYQVQIANLQPNQSVNKSQGFTITWSNFNNPTDGAKVILIQKSSGVSFEKEGSDNGSITLSALELSNFNSGSFELILITGNMVIVELNANGDWGYAVYYSHHDIPLNFQ